MKNNEINEWVKENGRHGASLAEASDAVGIKEGDTVDYRVVIRDDKEVFDEINEVGGYVVIGEYFS